MASSNPYSTSSSRISTPKPRFAPQTSTAEDLLKSQTVGLVHLSDFRKRRAEALEQKKLETRHHQQHSKKNGSLGRFALAGPRGAMTPNSDGVGSPVERPKKKQKAIARGKLSFGVDEEGEDSAETPRSNTPDGDASATASPAPPQNVISMTAKSRLGPNANLTVAPKVMTKSALLREAQTRERLRKEYLSMQEAVKATEVIIPFVFYDGTNIPGGACKVKKGDHIWLFLDQSRKVGAELGVGGGEKANSRREWARVGVDDLMLVRGEIIVPHHYELYYFIVNKTLGPRSTPLFDFLATDVSASSASLSPEPESYDPVSLPTKVKRQNNGLVTSADRDLEGYNDDPNFTKVVDRRWYERNKHIFPASVWEEFDPGKDYANGSRKDAEGNAFFFS